MNSRIACCIAIGALGLVILGCGHEPRSGQLAAGHRALQETVSAVDEAEDPRKRGIVPGSRGQEAGAGVAGEPAEPLSGELEDDG